MKQLILYKPDDDGVECAYFEKILSGTCDDDEGNTLFMQIFERILNKNEDYHLPGNLWHNYLTLKLVFDENTYSLACERGKECDNALKQIAIRDLGIYRSLYKFGFLDHALQCGFGEREIQAFKSYSPSKRSDKLLDEEMGKKIHTLSEALVSTGSAAEFTNVITKFYEEYGVGMLGIYRAFRIGAKDGGALLKPICNPASASLDDLVGYDRAKKRLYDNTKAFVTGHIANNCLLFGEAGTGKSTAIKGILNDFAGDGLKMIEVYKHQYKELHRIIEYIRRRNYRFIIFMDDLSFEDFEVEYKYLKAVIEGGLEEKPSNMLIYATSNRRHLIKESFKDKADRDEELHTNDTVQEKLSLSSRFGITIFFERPEKNDYNIIVKTLAARKNIEISDEELMLLANQWEVSHGGRSGRVARQLIDYLDQ